LDRVAKLTSCKKILYDRIWKSFVSWTVSLWYGLFHLLWMHCTDCKIFGNSC
jgi:hypothetical protein